MNTKLCNKEKFSLNEARNLLKVHKNKQTLDSCIYAIKNDLESIEIYKILSKDLFNLKNYNSAYDFVKEGPIIAPNEYLLLNDLANIYKIKGNIKSAKEFHEKALSLNEKYVPALTNLERVELLNKNIIKALNLMEKVLENDPDFAQGWTNLTYTSYNIGKFDNAKEAIYKRNYSFRI